MQGLSIDVKDIEKLSDEEMEKLFEVLDIVEEITVTNGATPVSKLLSVEYYNILMEGM